MVYVIVNLDNSIHTVSEKNDDVLKEGQTKYQINNFPEKHPIYYKWDNIEKKLKLKTENELKPIKDKEDEGKIKIKIEAKQKLLAIEQLEIEDSNEDYSTVKAIYKKIIDDNKK